MRPLRQLDDQADSLAAHQPQRPGWTCTADDQDWPCEPLREYLVDTMPAQSIGVVMDGYYRFAVIELNGPAAEVHRRMFEWIRGVQPAPSLGWHPPGGPW